MKLTRVLLVDDDEATRDGISIVLGARPDIEVIGAVDNREAALGLIAKAAPDVVLLDIGIPGDDGLDIARQVMAEYPRVRVIILSALDYREQEVRLMGLTFILKGCDTKELLAVFKE